MHLERYGSGSQVYFGLHGWSGDHTTFAPLADHLPAGASLYSADLPGFGQSQRPSRWELAVIRDEIVAAISRIEARAVTLIGNCSGALLGLLAAQAIPKTIERLILIDPFAYWPWYFRVFVAPGLGRYAYYSTFANPVGRWLTNLTLSNKRTVETHLTQSFASVNHETTYRYLVMLSEIEGIDHFGQMNMPIDIIYGERTFGAVKESASLWRNVWPQARCWELRGAGHLPIEEATLQLSSIVFARASSLAHKAAAPSSNRGVLEK